MADQAKRRAEAARYISIIIKITLHLIKDMIFNFGLVYCIYSNAYFNFDQYFSRLKELHTLKGHVESVVKLKGLNIDTVQQHYTL